jgi:hypothetical protein
MLLGMGTATARVQQIVSLVAELTPEERLELADRLETVTLATDPKRARVAEAIRRVVHDHPTILTALAK